MVQTISSALPPVDPGVRTNSTLPPEGSSSLSPGSATGVNLSVRQGGSDRFVAVAKTGDVYESERGTRVEISELTPERLTFTRRYPPDTGKAGGHLHLDFVQAWEVRSGTASIEVDGEPRKLGPGEGFEVPIGTKHRDPFNETGQDVVIDWRLEPNNAFIEGFFDALAYLLEHGGTTDQDDLPFLQILVLIHATKAKSYGDSPPIPIQKATLPLLAWIGRLRGYKASYAGGASGSTSRPTQ
jgi:mannose-6-phosphate isomerase-like protein (cupin superfamily)